MIGQDQVLHLQYRKDPLTSTSPGLLPPSPVIWEHSRLDLDLRLLQLNAPEAVATNHEDQGIIW